LSGGRGGGTGRARAGAGGTARRAAGRAGVGGERTGPLGALLAGGAGRRLGGDKLHVPLLGRPLALWALDALRGACDDVVVVAKPGLPLPALPDAVGVLREPAEPRHPLAGVVAALGHAAGRPVLVLAADLPLVPGALLRALLDAPGEHAVAVTDDRVQPLCARLGPAALGPLSAALDAAAPATAAIEALAPARVPAEPEWLLNVNEPADVPAAEAALNARARS
jgi:molybdopterin-guanine dinucleotide biosynthesis protein A